MFKKKSKLRDLLVSKLVHKIRMQSIALRESINIIKDYGNKRKKHKISQQVYTKVSGAILSLPIQLEVLREIVTSNKKMNKKYLSMLRDVNMEMERQVREQMQARPAPQQPEPHAQPVPQESKIIH